MLRLAGLILLAVPSVAAADVVGPIDPSVTCPEGSRVETNHCGTVCIARRCTTSAECGSGQVCRPDVSLCVVEEPYCGGCAGDCLYERVTGTCAAGCMVGECQTFGACVPGSAGTDAGSTGRDAGGAPADAGPGSVVTYGCGCRAGGVSTSGGLAVLALLALVASRRRGVRC